ncbi:hypothetical protein ACIGWV_08060 [Streptomyces sp. NPDC055082]
MARTPSWAAVSSVSASAVSSVVVASRMRSARWAMEELSGR